MDINEEYLASDRKNLLNSISKIKNRIKDRNKPKLNPYQISIYIKNSIIAQKQNSLNVPLDPIPDFIRKFHDFYGWMSKGSLNDIGLCSGSFYRTLEFINIDPEKRSGRKLDRKFEYGIHIEHTIPVKSIRSVLFNNVNEQTSHKEIFDMILNYSVCTGFSRVNEITSIKKGQNSSHPQFIDGKLLSPANIKPFMRYNGDTIIYSILSGNTVSLDSDLESINSHLKEYEIFNWDFLERYYANTTNTASSNNR